MATYREAVYMVLDFLKLSSDDAYYTEDHVKFLLNKFRAYVLKSKYEDNKKNPASVPSDDNAQTLDLTLEHVNGIDGVPCTGHFLRSVEEIPSPMFWFNLKVWAGAMFGDNIILTMPTRFRFAGTGRLASKFNYATIGPDNHLYLKSGNPQLYYLEKASIRGIFEDPEKAYEIEDIQVAKDGETPACDVMDKEFPLESNLLALCMQYVVKELSGSTYKPADNDNNAADDLSELAQFIRSYMKSPLRKQLDI